MMAEPRVADLIGDWDNPVDRYAEEAAWQALMREVDETHMSMTEMMRRALPFFRFFRASAKKDLPV
jgi:hypothetical protein